MNEKEVKDLLGCILGILAILVSPLGYILNGWVLSLLWEWFVVSVFGVPALGIAQAIGLSIIIGFLTRHVSYAKADEDALKNLIKAYIAAFFSPLFTLGVAWIVHQFA